MTRRDISAGMRLKTLAGWNQTEADWERFLGLSPEGSFAAEKDGQVIGTACTFVFGAVGWIAMILVDPEHRRHRLGSALFQSSLDYLRTKHLTAIKLDATPAGKEVYLRFGFQEEYTLERRKGISPGGEYSSIIPMSEADLAGIFKMDQKIYGADRSALLAHLFSEAKVNAFAGTFPGRTKEHPRGFAFIRPGSGSFFIGPIIA
ncbi:MAG: GNAT family N-acetyltransferase, partial [Spirochaetia bacterium]|nr:GNAT family N-acetyltransferase [Spirochaetia bacterium]